MLTTTRQDLCICLFWERRRNGTLFIVLINILFFCFSMAIVSVSDCDYVPSTTNAMNKTSVILQQKDTGIHRLAKIKQTWHWLSRSTHWNNVLAWHGGYVWPVRDKQTNDVIYICFWEQICSSSECINEARFKLAPCWSLCINPLLCYTKKIPHKAQAAA